MLKKKKVEVKEKKIGKIENKVEKKIEKKVEKAVSTVEKNEKKEIESPTAIMAKKIEELMRK